MAGVFAHSAGSFKTVNSISANSGGSWKPVQDAWENNNGVWIKVFPAIIREPATGENFVSNNTDWFYEGNSGGCTIKWAGATIYNYFNDATVMKVGDWTYYRGTRRNGDRYGIWRTNP